MSVYDLLTEKDKNLWLEYTEKYTEYADHISKDRADISYLLREWRDAKDQFLGKLFNNSLIFNQHISYTMGLTEKNSRLSEAGLFRSRFYTAIADWAYNMWYHIDWDLYHSIDRLIGNINNFSENKYSGPTFSIPYKVNDITKTLKIQSGCKTLKALSKIFTTFSSDIQATEQDMVDFQNQLSVLLNDTSLTGDMCFSIHPLDYVTASDNNCRWSSCMNWRNCGEYHRGTIEMMNSACVIVVYLNAADPMHLIDDNRMDDEWSNKKWREFFIVTEDLIVPIKGYPYINHNLEQIAIQILAERMSEKKLVNGTFGAIEQIVPGETTKNDYVFYFNSSGAMYNDFDSLSEVYLTYSTNCDKTVDMDFNGVSTCIWCGETGDFDCESDVLCNECANAGPRCCMCGERIDTGWYVDGYYYCENCYWEYTDTDVITGERHMTDRMTAIAIIVGDKITSSTVLIDEPEQYDFVKEVCVQEKIFNWWSETQVIHNNTYLVIDINDLEKLSEEIQERIYNYIDVDNFDKNIHVINKEYEGATA